MLDRDGRQHFKEVLKTGYQYDWGEDEALKTLIKESNQRDQLLSEMDRMVYTNEEKAQARENSRDILRQAYNDKLNELKEKSYNEFEEKRKDWEKQRYKDADTRLLRESDMAKQYSLMPEKELMRIGGEYLNNRKDFEPEELHAIITQLEKGGKHARQQAENMRIDIQTKGDYLPFKRDPEVMKAFKKKEHYHSLHADQIKWKNQDIEQHSTIQEIFE